MGVRRYGISLRMFNLVMISHKKRNFIYTSWHVLFCILYKHTNDDFLDDFPNISEHFPKIFENSPKLVRRVDNRLRTFSENVRRFLKKNR